MNESQHPATSKSAVRPVANAQLKPPMQLCRGELVRPGVRVRASESAFTEKLLGQPIARK